MTCLACGKPKHWPARCHEIVTNPVTKPVTKPVTNVTPIVTCERCVELEARIAELERKPLTNAQRQKAFRERRRNG